MKAAKEGQHVMPASVEPRQLHRGFDRLGAGVREEYPLGSLSRSDLSELLRIFRQAVELGITCWDTANIYAAGTSEEIVGRAMRKYTKRDDVVLYIGKATRPEVCNRGLGVGIGEGHAVEARRVLRHELCEHILRRFGERVLVHRAPGAKDVAPTGAQQAESFAEGGA